MYVYVCEEKQGASGGRCFAVLRLANSPEQTHQRDQRQRCAPNHPGAASRAGGVSALSSFMASASQMAVHRHRQGAGGHRHAAQAGRAGGALAHCGAGQAPNRARRCALCPAVDWAPPTGGCRVSYCHMPDGRWQLPWRPQVVGWWADQRGHNSHYHQSAPPHTQTDRGIVIYERNESRNKSEGVVEVCTAPKITFRMVSVY